MPEDLDAEYVLPLLRRDRRGEDELVRYLSWLGDRLDVTVVDASPADLFAALDERLSEGVVHVPPAASGLNGKARGVLTGLEVSRHDRVIIADDDIRYDDVTLRAVVDRLAEADFVRPQNVFASFPWHARWDTARSLIGRAFGGDYGGTVGVRRRTVVEAGGYSADVLFENLELERTVALSGGRVDVARRILVPRLPPTAAHFAGQRVRQAYDDLAQPARLAVEAALLPGLAAATLLRRWRLLAVFAATAVGVAEYGRRVAGGRRAFPATSALWAPVWLLERAVAVWIALGWRLRGGIPYAGSRIFSAATPVSLLRRRLTTTEGLVS
ncbi:hypothetical protein ASD56_00730 [Microbacterium sp. Root166]|uniref:glycosyltransferase n=1 Tax=Microbacterium sp. Root166 TaxID=1736478 RepID=UPI0006FCAAA2|nr:glycosyltransferase family 2 protein [Microbacterium sp. Root166]KQZ86164.1 hypothetical protein ASD56_00730 [Microbacterium sp. Root166]